MSKYVSNEFFSNDNEGTHAANVAAAAAVRDAAVKTTQAQADAASVTYARTVLASAKANNSNRDYEPAMNLLRSLGLWS